jgi:hypothetical protein
MTESPDGFGARFFFGPSLPDQLPDAHVDVEREFLVHLRLHRRSHDPRFHHVFR